MVAFEVVVGSVLRDDETKVPLTEWDNLGQALRFDRSDKPLRVSIQIRAARRQRYRLDVSGSEDLSEILGEEWITVVDQIPRVAEKALTIGSEIPGDLLHPVAIRPSRNTRDLYGSGLQVDHEQNEVARQTSRRQELHAEEIRRGDRTPVRLQERRPRQLLSALGSGLEPAIQEDSLDRASTDFASQVVQRAADPRVAPAGIFASHRDHEALDLARRFRSADVAGGATVVLL